MPADPRQARLAAIAGPCETPTEEVLRPLIAALEQRYGDTLAAVVFYGSCLRSGDPFDGLIDLYVIVDSYRRAHGNPLSALGNAAVPPNVYYLERDTPQGRLRTKYAVLSLAQLDRGAGHWFQAGVWGRLAQPVALIHARSQADAERVRAACGAAVISLLQRALPALPVRLEPAEAFAGALALSYRCELRVESRTRGGELVVKDAAEYRRRLLAALPLLPFAATLEADGGIAFSIATARRRAAGPIWALRRTQGKLLSILRLVKACFTFSDAIDYAAWKLERHTGVVIEITPRLRRHPLIFGWGLLWRLYRRRAVH